MCQNRNVIWKFWTKSWYHSGVPKWNWISPHHAFTKFSSSKLSLYFRNYSGKYFPFTSGIWILGLKNLNLKYKFHCHTLAWIKLMSLCKKKCFVVGRKDSLFFLWRREKILWECVPAIYQLVSLSMRSLVCSAHAHGRQVKLISGSLEQLLKY